MAITVTVRAGAQTRRYSSTKTNYAQQVADSILEGAKNRSKILVIQDAGRLSKQLTLAANKELLKVGQFMAYGLLGVGAMIGRVSAMPNAMTNVFSAGGYTLQWKGITRYKSNKNRDVHYINTGALRTAIAGIGPSILNRTGAISVKVVPTTEKLVDGSSRVRVGELQIKIAPRVGNILPGLDSSSGDWTKFRDDMAFERGLSLGRSVMSKLRGPRHGLTNSSDGSLKSRPNPPSSLGVFDPYHRPLIQPAVQYWLLYKIPEAIDAALAKKFKVEIRK